MKIFQHHLPFNAHGEHGGKQAFIDWGGTHGEWWYIERRYDTSQCLYADEKGNYYFGPKELSRVVPVVWNSKKEAGHVARKQMGRARRYLYRLSVR